MEHTPKLRKMLSIPLLLGKSHQVIILLLNGSLSKVKDHGLITIELRFLLDTGTAPHNASMEDIPVTMYKWNGKAVYICIVTFFCGRSEVNAEFQENTTNEFPRSELPLRALSFHRRTQAPVMHS